MRPLAGTTTVPKDFPLSLWTTRGTDHTSYWTVDLDGFYILVGRVKRINLSRLMTKLAHVGELLLCVKLHPPSKQRYLQ